MSFSIIITEIPHSYIIFPHQLILYSNNNLYSLYYKILSYIKNPFIIYLGTLYRKIYIYSPSLLINISTHHYLSNLIILLYICIMLTLLSITIIIYYYYLYFIQIFLITHILSSSINFLLLNH